LVMQLSRSISGKRFLEVDTCTDFEPKIEECLLSSLHQIAKRILIPMSTVRCHLVNSLGRRIRNIRWVPHSLSSSQNKHVSRWVKVFFKFSREPSTMLGNTLLHSAKPDLFSNHFDRIWFPHNELPPSFPRQTNASQKLMITVVWNPHEFDVIQSLSNGIKWTGRKYSDNILS
jgi:hypothetical protein